MKRTLVVVEVRPSVGLLGCSSSSSEKHTPDRGTFDGSYLRSVPRSSGASDWLNSVRVSEWLRTAEVN